MARYARACGLLGAEKMQTCWARRHARDRKLVHTSPTHPRKELLADRNAAKQVAAVGVRGGLQETDDPSRGCARSRRALSS
jgi:hypothetical protein